MKVLLAVTMSFFLLDSISGQQTKSYIVKAGERISEAIPADGMYAFPAFKAATVFMRDGSISAARLNYNIFLNEMQFIGNKGDTMAIAYPETIKYISIDTTLYFYDKTYLQVVLQIDSFKLAIKQSFSQAPYRTRGGYDVPTAVSAITTYSSINTSNGSGNLQAKKDVIFERTVSYFISDKFNHFFKADKKSFLNIFSNNKSLIQDYMNRNKTDFFNKNALEKLLKFCVSNS
jgi:hypothetical protein